MKNGYQHYFSALTSYEEGANQLSAAPSSNVSAAKQMMERAQQQNIPLQNDPSLVEHLADPENRVPSQLYAVIGEILKLIKSIEQQ
ncbi:MAG TPA: flagellar biosynthesis protein FlhB [Anoxybacillus sp.]|jgi:flagellar biosynthesis protein|nr:flagellar biosynthesis protein FlhB [Anoxybacillus sp.]